MILRFLNLGLCCFMASAKRAAAQPKITVQPVNAAVGVGQDAQFTVTASGSAPLQYQWRFEGAELSGATNRILNLTNLALSNLGIYDVLVTDLSGTAASNPSVLMLASRWTELVVFGASSETPQCGGLAWPAYVANRLGVRLRNYAGTGAGIRAQITSYLSGNTPTTNTLIGHWAGGSYIDIRFGTAPDVAAANRVTNMRLLMEAGARHFLMPTLWPPEMNLGLAQAFPNFTAEQVLEFDTHVSEGLAALQTQYDLKIYRPDAFLFFMAMLKEPTAFGFTPPFGPKGPFVCDSGHFTTETHALMSQQLYPSLTPPLRIDSALRSVGGNLTIRWTGGSPPFRVQKASDLLSGRWETVGEPGFSMSAAITHSNPQAFFRVLSLGN
jgi:hypothetical protein